MRTRPLNWGFIQFHVVRCLAGAGMVALLTTILFLLRSQLGTPVVALLYLLPVGLAALLWGLPAALTAAVGAFLTFNYFFIPPYNSLAVHTPSDLLALLTFLVVATVISQLMGRARAREAEAKARERDAVHLYELTLALAGLTTREAIAHALAGQLQAVFQPEMVEVVIQYEPSQTPRLARLPAGSPAPETTPTYVAPLMAAKGLIGELRLWREAPFTQPAEDRLLRLFANEGALAIERARLSQAETAAQVLGESDRLKSALLSSVSHELRTPLATIKAAATSLRQGEVAWEAESRAELLEIMEEEADHLNRLVGNLLDMSRIEAGALQPQRQWNQLSEVAESALARLRRAAEQHTVQIDVPEDLPLVPVDTALMQQVFVNLLSNSIKFAPPHTLIRVSAKAADEETLRVQVSNQGPPVPEKDLKHIFDKFYRVTAADRVTGTGLGLSICKGIVEAHGGRIWAENLRDGLAFNFILPLTWGGTRRPATLPAEEVP